MRAAFELGEPYLQLPLAAPYRRMLGRGGLFGLGQLALDRLQPFGQLARVVLARAETTGEPVDLGAAVALELRAAVLGLDAQLLLGVLALLDATQLVLTLGDRRLLGIEPPGEERSLLSSLLHPLLEAGQMSLECLHGRLSRLCTAGESIRRVGGIRINRAARAALGQQITVS
jgi:hypothetical protein